MNDEARGMLVAMAMVGAGAAFAARPTVPPLPPPKPAMMDEPTVSPHPARSSVHRKLHRTAPKIARHQWQPIPGVRPLPPIMREEKRARYPAKKRQIATSFLPPCSVVRREAARMTWAQKLAAYSAATPEQVAHGRRCLLSHN